MNYKWKIDTKIGSRPQWVNSPRLSPCCLPCCPMPQAAPRGRYSASGQNPRTEQGDARLRFSAVPRENWGGDPHHRHGDAGGPPARDHGQYDSGGTWLGTMACRVHGRPHAGSVVAGCSCVPYSALVWCPCVRELALWIQSRWTQPAALYILSCFLIRALLWNAVIVIRQHDHCITYQGDHCATVWGMTEFMWNSPEVNQSKIRILYAKRHYIYSQYCHYLRRHMIDEIFIPPSCSDDFLNGNQLTRYLLKSQNTYYIFTASRWFRAIALSHWYVPLSIKHWAMNLVYFQIC